MFFFHGFSALPKALQNPSLIVLAPPTSSRPRNGSKGDSPCPGFICQGHVIFLPQQLQRGMPTSSGWLGKNVGRSWVAQRHTGDEGSMVWHFFGDNGGLAISSWIKVWKSSIITCMVYFEQDNPNPAASNAYK